MTSRSSGNAYDIVIVGGGSAGITAAARDGLLQKNKVEPHTPISTLWKAIATNQSESWLEVASTARKYRSERSGRFYDV